MRSKMTEKKLQIEYKSKNKRTLEDKTKKNPVVGCV